MFRFICLLCALTLLAIGAASTSAAAANKKSAIKDEVSEGMLGSLFVLTASRKKSLALDPPSKPMPPAGPVPVPYPNIGKRTN